VSEVAKKKEEWGEGGEGEKEMATHSNILAWRSMDRGAWKAVGHGVAKELDTT